MLESFFIIDPIVLTASSVRLSRPRDAGHWSSQCTFECSRSSSLVLLLSDKLPVVLVNIFPSNHFLSRVFRSNPKVRAISRELFGNHDLTGKAVLIHTGWDTHWRTEQYFEGYAFLTGDAAEYLKASGVTLVGIDSCNIDDTADRTRPVHSILLGAEIPIVEHMCNLEKLPDSGFTFYAVPVKIKGFGTFPVRAFGVVAAQFCRMR